MSSNASGPCQLARPAYPRKDGGADRRLRRCIRRRSSLWSAGRTQSAGSQSLSNARTCSVKLIHMGGSLLRVEPGKLRAKGLESGLVQLSQMTLGEKQFETVESERPRHQVKRR